MIYIKILKIKINYQNQKYMNKKINNTFLINRTY